MLRDPYLFLPFSPLSGCQRHCHYVLPPAIPQTRPPSTPLAPSEVMNYVNVFRPLQSDWMLEELYCPLGIAVNRARSVIQPKIVSELAKPQ